MTVYSISKNSKYRFLFAIAIVAMSIISCGSSKNFANKSNSHTTTKKENLRKLGSKNNDKISGSVKRILNDAEKYLGSPYKFGGNTAAGFDCSGFTVKVFQENNFSLPRRSEDQSNVGKNINIMETKPGDLLFFATGGGTRVSHVGLVHSIGSDGEIKFIHSSTSKGVIISSLNDKYWNKAYLHAQRVL
ncbi:C40 family peptidase [Chryseobacterium sp.]|uniref:C40 family peptidase n=1 Tax=Chryseobacterium sp. TaxID=1871047 RepID=UPI00388DD61D